MADILFKPTCSNCGTVIHEIVDIESKILLIPPTSNSKICWDRYYHFTPSKCPVCDKPFEHVQMPFKLPYNPTDFKEVE